MPIPRGLLIGSFALVLTGFILACAESEPCDEYVDYICDCHAEDPAYDCESLRTSYETADDSLQDECSIALANLEEQDERDGVGCVTEDTGTDTGAGGGGDDTATAAF